MQGLPHSSSEILNRLEWKIGPVVKMPGEISHFIFFLTKKPCLKRLGIRVLIVLPVIAFFSVFGVSYASETIRISNENTIQGTVVNTENPRQKWAIETEDGIFLELSDGNVVTGVLHPPKALEQYEARVPFVPESVESQLKLARICKSQKLDRLAELHYRRVLELDPEQAEARQALGYEKIGGTWTTRDEEMRKLGYVQDKKGGWTTAQRLLIDEDKVRLGEEDRQLTKAIDQMIRELNGPDSKKAEQALYALKNPTVLKPLLKVLAEEKNPAVRIILVRALGGLNTLPAMREIAYWSMQEQNEDVRFTCYSILKDRPGMSRLYYPYLKSKDNQLVNEAGVALGQLGDQSAIPALIDALITRHTVNVTVPSGGMTQMVTSPNGDKSFSVNIPNPPHVEKRDEILSNRGVLNALRRLSGNDFEYNIPLWQEWWSHQQRSSSFDARHGSID